MKKIRINIDASSGTFVYPLDMALVSNKEYSDDKSYLLGDVSNDLVLVEGTATATDDDQENVLSIQVIADRLSAQVKAIAGKLVDTGIVFNGDRISTTEASQNRAANAMLLYQLKPTKRVLYITGFDNNVLDLGKDEHALLFGSISEYVADVINATSLHLIAIFQAALLPTESDQRAALRVIDFDVGWPSNIFDTL